MITLSRRDRKARKYAETCLIQGELCHRHINPNGDLGGWVGPNAHVSGSVYMEPDTMVLGTSKVTGPVYMGGNAKVLDKAEVSGKSHLGDHSTICDGATVIDSQVCDALIGGDDTIVRNSGVFDGTKIYGGEITDDTLLTGNSTRTKVAP